MNQPLILSLFPGADLLGMAFEAEGFCVVRGPDALLGGDIRTFHIPRGRFDGIIGGPPCKAHSVAVLSCATGPTQGNLIPEFERIVLEGEPEFFLMENVPGAPIPFGSSVTFSDEEPQKVFDYLINAWDCGANQKRTRRFSSNLLIDPWAQMPDVFERTQDPWPCVTATEHKVSAGSNERTMRQRAGRKVGRKMTIREVNEAMGLPADWDTPALTSAMAYQVRGNGVPLPMGRVMARAIKAALYDEAEVVA